jgi:release factor glutamine methyltransferase
MWAEELVGACPPGPILELFAGSGHIGLEASRRTGRPAVLVDQSPEACRLAIETARNNGLRASVVQAAVSRDSCEWVRPGVVLADPPYVPESEVGRFPSDPIEAIDGGPDGLSLVRSVLRAVQPALRPNVPLILQLRGLGQAAAVDRWLEARTALGMRIDQVRCYGFDRALVLIRLRRW